MRTSRRSRRGSRWRRTTASRSSPFNLEQERREGFFDEEGHYVEKKDEEEKDAWLASGEGLRTTWFPRRATSLLTR